MKTYDRTRPLIAIHVPKAAGTSVRQVFETWFGRRLYRHYYHEIFGLKPRRTRLRRLFSSTFREGVCIYGHFNRTRQMGIEHDYPEVQQFVTVLRDPFELAVSEYFYLRDAGRRWRDKSRIPTDDIETYLARKTPNMLDHFPRPLTLDDYREKLCADFIHIGITEDLAVSLRAMAHKLGFVPPAHIEELNRTERGQVVPYAFKEAFAARHPLEFAVYAFAREIHAEGAT